MWYLVGVVCAAALAFAVGVLFGRKNPKKVQAVIDVTHQLEDKFKK